MDSLSVRPTAAVVQVRNLTLRASSVRRTRSGALMAEVELLDEGQQLTEVADLPLLDLGARDAFANATCRVLVGSIDDSLVAELAAMIRTLALQLWTAERKSINHGTSPGLVREFGAGELQREVIAGGAGGVQFLPLLGSSGYIGRSQSTLVSGWHKAGKSTLIRRLIEDWCPEPVLILSEEGRGIWAAHLRHRPVGDWDHVRLVYALGMDRADMLSRIADGYEKIIIIDTLRTLLGVESENDNAEVARALGELIAACGSRTLIAVHADRKSGGEHATGVAGAGAFVGIVDTVLQMGRDTSKRTRRVISGIARTHEVVDLAYELTEDGRLLAVGPPSAVGLAEVKSRLMDVLGGDWKTTKAEREALAEPRPAAEQVRLALLELALPGVDDDGISGPEVERDPPAQESNVRGRTVLWRRT